MQKADVSKTETTKIYWNSGHLFGAVPICWDSQRGRGKSIKEDIMEGTDNHCQFVKEKGKAP